MSSYSYSDWSSLKQEEREQFPGVSVSRQDPVNNPNRGVYWSGTTAAKALMSHVQGVLSGDDRLAAQRMMHQLRQKYREGAESTRMVNKAIYERRADANAALDSYHGDLNSEQLEQLTSVFDDVVSLQRAAGNAGLDPVTVTNRMLDRAAAKAVGFDLGADSADREIRAILGTREEANLDQSVRQLQATLKNLELDALDHVAVIGREAGYDEETRDEHSRLRDILGSIPRILEPVAVEEERNFSVRMDTKEEATAMETMIRWAGQQKGLPEPQEIHRVFNSWRDSGLLESPFTALEPSAVGIVVGRGAEAVQNLSTVLEGIEGNAKIANGPLVVLAVEGGDRLREELAKSGRPVTDAVITAGQDGVSLTPSDPRAGNRRIELIDLGRDEANDPVARSLAANAFVGRSSSVGYVEGTRMHAVEAQAIHIAGTSRKLSLGVGSDGEMMNQNELRRLRAEALSLDKEADPQRYFTAGQSRPFQGVYGVAFDGARHFDKANNKHARGRDLIGEAYERIPSHATILTVDQPQNAVVRWMDENVGDRKVLYAEARRNLSFAEVAGAGLEGERIMAREANMEMRIYDRPAHAREWETISRKQYGEEQYRAREAALAAGEDYAPPVTREVEGNSDLVTVMRTPEVQWNSPEVRGAIVLVSGNAYDQAINTNAQAVKIAQEAVMDRAHSAVILNDFGTDFHAAHMIRLAREMDKRATVMDGAGTEVPLAEARERTRQHGQGIEDVRQAAFRDRPHDHALGSDVGQLALSALPGMSTQLAQKLIDVQMTVKELANDRSEETRKMLLDRGIPYEARNAIADTVAWGKALDRAESIALTVDNSGGTLFRPDEQMHPLRLANGPEFEPKHNVIEITSNPEAFDYSKLPLAAFIGGSAPYQEPGVKGHVDPADTIDRTVVRRTIEEMTANGYGIVVPLEQGVSRAVLEESLNVPDAKVVMVAPGNPMAAAPEVRNLMAKLLDEERGSILTPDHIAPIASDDPQVADRYVENRHAMREIVAGVSSVGVVVAVSDKDQSLHVVRQMIDQEKPIAAIVPQNADMASSELYSGNLKLLRGAGKTSIQSENAAQGVSAQGYAELLEDSTGVILDGGVMRGNAGTFQSARLARNEMLRSGHHYQQFGWGAAARPISSPESIARLVQDVSEGQGPVLGRYVEKTDREIEKARLDRFQPVSEEVQAEFRQHSRIHGAAIMAEAGRSIGMG